MFIILQVILIIEISSVLYLFSSIRQYQEPLPMQQWITPTGYIKFYFFSLINLCRMHIDIVLEKKSTEGEFLPKRRF